MAFFGNQNPNLPPPPAPSGPIPTAPPIRLRSSKVPEGKNFTGGSRLAGLTVIFLSKNSVPDLVSFALSDADILVFSMRLGASSQVMLAEAVSSAADILNQIALAVGLISSRSSRHPPNETYPYGQSKNVFVCCLISATWIFVIGWGGTLYEGFQHYWPSKVLVHGWIVASVLVSSFKIEGATLKVAILGVKKGAAAKGMKMKDYVWHSLDPTSTAVMIEDGAAVTGLIIVAASLLVMKITGNPIYDVVGLVIIANILGSVIWVV